MVDLTKLANDIWEANNKWGEPDEEEAKVAWNVCLNHLIDILDRRGNRAIFDEDIEELIIK